MKETHLNLRHSNEWTVIRKQVSGKDIPTKFDLSSIGDLSDNEIGDIVEEFLWSSLDDTKIYSKINRVYQKIIEYMLTELFYTPKELKRFTSLTFSQKDDVVNFLKETRRHRGVLNCVIIKLFQAFHDADEEFNDRVKAVKEKTTQVIEDKLIRRLQIKKSNGDKLSGETFIEIGRGMYRKIPFTIKKRLKSTNSSISKEVRDPTYFTAEMISDWYGATVEVEKKEDILPLMQMISAFVFKKWDFEVKNDKWMFSEDEIYANGEISDIFKEVILSGTKTRDKIESGDVQDIKLVTSKEKWEGLENLSLEIKFVLKKNQNEDGLNMHGVYNYMKKISERVRLEGSVSNEYIELVAQNFLLQLPQLLYTNPYRKEEEGDKIDEYKQELFRDLRKNGHILSSLRLTNSHTKSRIDDHILQWLVSYYKSKLIQVRKEEWKTRYYTNKRGLKMSEWGENQVGAVWNILIDARD